MHKQPKVTVIIPYKENLNLLYHTIKSVFKQTYNNFEIILIFDNEDKTDLAEIKNFIKKCNKNKLSEINFKIIVNEKCLGAGYSRNIGIKKAKSKYIAFIDSDDLWKKKKLEIQISFMERKKQDFSHTSYYIIGHNGNIISSRVARKKINYKNLIQSCDIGLSTVAIRTKLLKQNNFYFPNIRTKEDYVLWLKLIRKKSYFVGINKKLTYYRKSKNSLSSNKLTSIINGYKVYRIYLNFGRLRSIYHLIILSLNYLKKVYNKSV